MNTNFNAPRSAGAPPPQDGRSPAHPHAHHPQAALNDHVLTRYAVSPVMSEPAPSRGFFTAYVALWSVLGACAAGYLTFALLTPRNAAEMHTASISDAPATAVATGDFAALKDSLVSVQLDLAKVKTEVANYAERDKSLTAQIAAIERRLPDSAGALDATQPGSETQPGGKDAAAGAAKPIETRAENAPALPKTAGTPAQPKLVNGETTALAPAADGLFIETGSLTAPKAIAQGGAKAAAASKSAAAQKSEPKIADVPLDLGAAVVKPAPVPAGVQISTGASVDSLRLSWSLLADRHGEALKNLEARYVAHGQPENPTYELIAGPIKTRADAVKVCKALTAKNVPCKVGDFLGEAL